MAELPYWFTNEDKSDPMYCRACKQHVPRSVLRSGKGLCPNCLQRVKSTSAPPEPSAAPVRTAEAPYPVAQQNAAYLAPKSSTPLAKAEPKKKISPHVYAVLILVCGAGIACIRLILKI